MDEPKNPLSLPASESNVRSIRAAWITRQAKLVLSGYRRDDFADPDGFVVQLGMVLERYPDDVISYVTNPLTGIQRISSQPPSIATIAQALENEVTRQTRIKQYREMGGARSGPRAPPEPANLFVPQGVPGYNAMVEWSKTADKRSYHFDHLRPGIHVPLSVYQGWNPRVKIHGPSEPDRMLPYAGG